MISRPRGFTLMELLVMITITSVLATVAVPALTRYVESQRLKAAAYDLEASLHFARSEALKRNAAVSVTPLGGGWENGWVVETGATSLKIVAGSKNLAGLALAGPAGGISYTGDGRTSSAAAVEIRIQSARAGSALPMRCIVLALTGQPLLKIDRDQDGSCANN